MPKINVTLTIDQPGSGFENEQAMLSWISACLNCNVNHARVKVELSSSSLDKPPMAPDVLARVESLHTLQQRAGAPYTLWAVTAPALAAANGDQAQVNWSQVHQAVFDKAVLTDKQPVDTVLEAIKMHSPGAVAASQIASIDEMGGYYPPNSDRRENESGSPKLIVGSLPNWLRLGERVLVYEADNGDKPYSKQMFVDLCEGNASLAYELFCQCEWQCPETVLDEEGGLAKFREIFKPTSHEPQMTS